MDCPNCKTTSLEESIFNETEVDHCPDCLGFWFDRGELENAKDEKDKNLNWVDIDLWKDEDKFRFSQGQKLCPMCFVPMHEAFYGTSKIKVDVCNLCHGVWLDRGEFKEIIEYLRRKGHYEVVNNYFKNLIKEAEEIFTGPEGFKSELKDFITISKLLSYKINNQLKRLK